MTIVKINKDYLISEDQDSITLNLSDDDLKQESKLLLQQVQNQQLEYQLENQLENQKLTDQDNPWIKLAGKYENDQMYDEIISYIEDYRHQLDIETVDSEA